MKITKSFLRQLIRESLEDHEGSRVTSAELGPEQEGEKPKNEHIDWEYVDKLIDEPDYVNALDVLNRYLSSTVKDPKQRQKKALEILNDRIENFDVPY